MQCYWICTATQWQLCTVCVETFFQSFNSFQWSRIKNWHAKWRTTRAGHVLFIWLGNINVINDSPIFLEGRGNSSSVILYPPASSPLSYRNNQPGSMKTSTCFLLMWWQDVQYTLYICSTTRMSLECGRKMEHPEEIQTGTGRRCRSRPTRLNSEPPCCEVIITTTVPYTAAPKVCWWF